MKIAKVNDQAAMGLTSMVWSMKLDLDEVLKDIAIFLVDEESEE